MLHQDFYTNIYYIVKVLFLTMHILTRTIFYYTPVNGVWIGLFESMWAKLWGHISFIILLFTVLSERTKYVSLKNRTVSVLNYLNTKYIFAINLHISITTYISTTALQAKPRSLISMFEGHTPFGINVISS